MLAWTDLALFALATLVLVLTRRPDMINCVFLAHSPCASPCWSGHEAGS